MEPTGRTVIGVAARSTRQAIRAIRTIAAPTIRTGKTTVWQNDYTHQWVRFVVKIHGAVFIFLLKLRGWTADKYIMSNKEKDNPDRFCQVFLTVDEIRHIQSCLTSNQNDLDREANRNPQKGDPTNNQVIAILCKHQRMTDSLITTFERAIETK